MEKFIRLINLIGDHNFHKIQEVTVLVVGLGGVGSYCLESLARNGIKNFILIDNDEIEKSNLNRQILALDTTIGQAKVEVAQKRIKKINTEAQITTLNTFLTADNINCLDSFCFDYLVDACDTLNTKVALAKYAQDKNIKLISSLGMGARIDATEVCLTRLDKTYNDPLAKKFRKLLKDQNLSLKIPVVFSKELPVKSRMKEISSCAHVAATAGLFITNYIINDILKKEI